MRYSTLFIFLSLCHLTAWGQPSNDACSDAERLCPGQPLQGTTTGATSTAAEEDNFCAIYAATVWYNFTTNNLGGNVTIDLTNVTFNPDPTYGQSIDVVMYEAATPCNGNYTPYTNCQFISADASFSNLVALAPNTTYYLMVNGTQFGSGVTNNAECDFQIEISGAAMDSSSPTVTISAANTTLCEGEDFPVDVNIANCNDTATYNWYYEGALIETTVNTNTFSTTSLSNSGNLYLIFDCGSLCVYSDTTDSIFFDVTPISANAGPDKFIADGDVTTLEGSGSGTPVWSPSNTLTNANILQPTANPTSTTTYFLTMTNGSCIATDSMNVFVGQVVTIFSAFSPNDDNINDKWVILNASAYENMEVVVYDRSGQVVFESTGYSTQDKWWDGTLMNDGKKLPVSTYYYVIDLKNGGEDEDVFKGQVNIIR